MIRAIHICVINGYVLYIGSSSDIAGKKMKETMDFVFSW